MAVQRTNVSIAEYEAYIALPENRERLFEMINGEIVEKMPTDIHGRIAFALTGELYIYLKQNPIGHGGVEVRHRVPGDEHNDLLPDVSFIADVTTPPVKAGPIPRMPDLAVEIKSPDDSLKKMREKADYYLANGTRLVWLILPDQRIVEVYTPDDEFVVGENQTLDGGSVLPGFAALVRDLFKNL